MKIRGPLVTVCAAAAVGAGMWFVNVAGDIPVGQPPQPAPQARVVETAPPATKPAPQFPRKADYAGVVDTAAGDLTIDISIDGPKASAYACDTAGIETWLRGSAANGAVSLANTDRSSRLEGRLQGDTVVGTLWVGPKRWQFTAPAAPLREGGSSV